MFSRVNCPSCKTIHLFLIALIVAFGLCIPAVNAPSFAAKTPAQVKNLKVVDITDFSFTIEWKAVKNAKHYEVNVKKASANKWSKVDVTTENWTKVDVAKCDTAYKVRVRAVNDGKKGKWSAVKTVRTKLKTPNAIWAKYISSSVIEVEWHPSYGAKQYKVTWDDMSTDILGSKVVKKSQTSFRVENLAESCGYSFKVQAKDGKKLSNAVMVDLSTYAEGCVLQKINPYSAKYSLTRFIQDSSEYDIPAMYITSFDDVGYLESDGFYFPDLYVEEITLKKGVMSQNVAGSLKKETITETQILHVGDTITTLGGQTVKIAQLRVTTNPNEVFENCIDYREAYTRIDDLDLYIETTIPGTGAPGPTMFVNWTRDWQPVY